MESAKLKRTAPKIPPRKESVAARSLSEIILDRTVEIKTANENCNINMCKNRGQFWRMSRKLACIELIVFVVFSHMADSRVFSTAWFLGSRNWSGIVVNLEVACTDVFGF